MRRLRGGDGGGSDGLWPSNSAGLDGLDPAALQSCSPDEPFAMEGMNGADSKGLGLEGCHHMIEWNIVEHSGTLQDLRWTCWEKHWDSLRIHFG